jgi:hypothetical protein
LATLVRLPVLRELKCPASADLACKLSGSNLFLVVAVSADAKFSHPAQVPDGFPGYSMPVPHPSAEGNLYVRLRDDPTVVHLTSLGAQQLPPTVAEAAHAEERHAAHAEPEPAPVVPKPTVLSSSSNGEGTVPVPAPTPPPSAVTPPTGSTGAPASSAGVGAPVTGVGVAAPSSARGAAVSAPAPAPEPVGPAVGSAPADTQISPPVASTVSAN